MKKFIMIFITIFSIVILSGCADYCYGGNEDRFFVQTSIHVFDCESIEEVIKHIEFITKLVSRYNIVYVTKLEKSNVSNNYEGYIIINNELYIINVTRANFKFTKGTMIEYARLEREESNGK